MKMYYLFVPLLFLTLSSCSSQKKEPIGQFDVVMTLTTPDVFLRYKNQLEEIFQKPIMTPQIEKEYSLIEGNWNSFETFSRWRNILVIGMLNDNSPPSRLILQSLKQDAIQLIRINQAFIFVKHDLWAKNQTVMFLIAKNDSIMAENLEVYGNEMYQIMDRDIKNRLKGWLYDKHERTNISEKLIKNYQFSIRVPQLYQLARDVPDSNYIWFTSSAPDRWILITWQDMPPGANITVNAREAADKRDSLTTRFYPHDLVVKKHTHARLVELNGMPTIELRGLWENDSLLVGGPFMNYQLFDRATRRYYIIDYAIFAPGLDKNIYLKQFEAIISTFKTYHSENSPVSDSVE